MSKHKGFTFSAQERLEHEGIDKCVACASCVVMCPVSRATADFLGPKLTGPALERFRLSELPETKWLEYCSNCKTCDVTCPFGVPVSLLNMSARAEYCKIHRPPLRDWILGHGKKLSVLASIVPNFILSFAMTNFISRYILDFLGIDKRAPMPIFAKVYFRKAFKRINQKGLKKEVVLFPGCYTDVYDPETGLDIVAMLNFAGYKVIVPKNLDCCALPMVANGYIDDASKNALRNFSILKDYSAKGIQIVAPCPSCCLMLSKEYEELFPEITKGYRLNIKDASEFISELIDKGEFKGEFKSSDHLQVIYHEPCHLRAQGVGKTGLKLMKKIKGAHLIDADCACCGISGSYGFKKGKYEISESIGSELFDKIKSSGATYGASECGTCRLQMTHGSAKPALHPITLMRKYYFDKGDSVER